MPLPTLAKTWQYDVNKLYATTGTALTDYRQTLRGIKDALVSLGWQVVRSSNGTAGGTGTGDNWNANGDLVWNAAGSAHSWIVLKPAAASSFQICIDLDHLYYPNHITLLASPSVGFSGGDENDRPADPSDVVNVLSASANDLWIHASINATFTARVHERDRRTKARPDVVFQIEGTAIGAVTRTAQPMLVPDIGRAADRYLDANVLHTAGFRSALIMPLVSNGRGVGTLNLVARAPEAFDEGHVDVLRGIAEILAVAHVAQRQHTLLARYRTIEAMADTTLSIASEVNGALQIIAGQCGLLERSYPDEGLQRDLATITAQARRIAELLEAMRVGTQERLRQAADTIDGASVQEPGARSAGEQN